MGWLGQCSNPTFKRLSVFNNFRCPGHIVRSEFATYPKRSLLTELLALFSDRPLTDKGKYRVIPAIEKAKTMNYIWIHKVRCFKALPEFPWYPLDVVGTR